MVDHALYLNAVNNSIRRAMLRILNEVEKTSQEDFFEKLKANNILDKEDVFKYHIDYLIQADCIKKIEEDGNKVNFEILQAGKVIEKY
jgi:hypothetical protein